MGVTYREKIPSCKGGFPVPNTDSAMQIMNSNTAVILLSDEKVYGDKIKSELEN
jgi:hypothetical protein